MRVELRSQQGSCGAGTPLCRCPAGLGESRLSLRLRVLSRPSGQVVDDLHPPGAPWASGMSPWWHRAAVAMLGADRVGEQEAPSIQPYRAPRSERRVSVPPNAIRPRYAASRPHQFI